MREFTKEEKELIVSTPITRDCFKMDEFTSTLWLPSNEDYEGVRLGQNICDVWKHLAQDLETLRLLYVQTGDERYFIELIRLLPNTYKVVKL